MCKHRKKAMKKSSSSYRGYKSASKRCRKQKFIAKVKKKSLSKRRNHRVAKVSFPGIVCCKSKKQRDDDGPLQYSVYCIVNSGFFKSKGSLVASVARGFMELYNKVARDRVKSKYLDEWEDSGEKLVILKGINHKHLEYLAEELFFAAVSTHSYYKTWSRSKCLLVLSVFGREEDIEEFLEGLTELR